LDNCVKKDVCQGTVLKELTARSEADCLHECQHFEGIDTNSDGIVDEYCNWFTFDNRGHTCKLLDGCLTTDYCNNYCFSGSFGCPSDFYGEEGPQIEYVDSLIPTYYHFRH